MRVAAPTSLALAGQVVKLIGASAEFIGPVVQVLEIELDPAGAAGVFTNCVVVRSRGNSQAYWIAAATAVEVVQG